MRKITKRQASALVKAFLGPNFFIGVVHHRFGPEIKSVYFSYPDRPLLAYKVAIGTDWREVLAEAGRKMTVSTF